MAKLMLIDATKCMACRGCQVACKQWNELPADATKFSGSYQNPPDMSGTTFTVVKFKERMNGGKVEWLFFKDQCRHCDPAPCLGEYPELGKKDASGAVYYYADKSKKFDYGNVRASCPYDIPRRAADGSITKCTLCVDRVGAGWEPACVKACPTGALSFGDRAVMIKKAKARLSEIKKVYPKAVVYPGFEDSNVIWLLAYPEATYGVAKARTIKRMYARRDFLGLFGRPLRRA